MKNKKQELWVSKEIKKIKSSLSSTKKISLIGIIVLILIGSLISAIITTAIYNLNGSSKYVKVDQKLQSLVDTYNEIVDNYYDKVDVDKVIDGGIKGMVDAVGDPYTAYMDDSTTNNFNILLNGSYKGLGIQVGQVDNKLVITGIIDNSPAKSANLKAGDIIKSIDGKTSEKMSSSDFSSYIQNSNKKDFDLVIIRDQKEINMKLKKDDITLQSVTSKVINESNKKIGYIYISIFASNTYTQFSKEIKNLEKSNIDSLIIDLRDNTGGQLVSAANMLSLLLDDSHVLYQIQTKNDVKKYFSYGKETKKYPICILVNGNTASASEIMASSLRNNLGSKLIGKKTYGKGTVQELLKLSTGKQYKITTQKWLTSTGEWINEKGLTPDIECDLSDEYKKNPSDESDNQLKSAINYLKEQ